MIVLFPVIPSVIVKHFWGMTTITVKKGTFDGKALTDMLLWLFEHLSRFQRAIFAPLIAAFIL
jgi:hypothetical protein